MPIFEYACRQCGREFEALVRADSVPECPHCRSTALDKQLSVFATSAAEPPPAVPSRCASCCGHPGGPGSCAYD
jgi:putative FmdB family regulatory protein